MVVSALWNKEQAGEGGLEESGWVVGCSFRNGDGQDSWEAGNVSRAWKEVGHLEMQFTEKGTSYVQFSGGGWGINEDISKWRFSGGTSGKEFACQCRRCGFDPWVRKIPWRKKQQSSPVFLPGESHRQRSLGGYSLWGCEESDMTEATTCTRCVWSSGPW